MSYEVVNDIRDIRAIRLVIIDECAFILFYKLAGLFNGFQYGNMIEGWAK